MDFSKLLAIFTLGVVLGNKKIRSEVFKSLNDIGEKVVSTVSKDISTEVVDNKDESTKVVDNAETIS